MSLVLIAKPSVEPVSLEELRMQRLIESTDQDGYLLTCAKAARNRLERETGRAFVDQTWEYRLEGFPSEIELPFPPCIDVTEVTYLDENEDEQTLDPSGYRVILNGDWNAVFRVKGSAPRTASAPDAVRIRFRAGWAYDEDASPPHPAENVPDDLKTAILLLAGHYFENREEVLLTPTRQELMRLPDGVAALISTWNVPRMW